MSSQGLVTSWYWSDQLIWQVQVNGRYSNLERDWKKTQTVAFAREKIGFLWSVLTHEPSRHRPDRDLKLLEHWLQSSKLGSTMNWETVIQERRFYSKINQHPSSSTKFWSWPHGQRKGLLKESFMVSWEIEAVFWSLWEWEWEFFAHRGLPADKHGGGSIILRGCFVSSVNNKLYKANGIM